VKYIIAIVCLLIATTIFFIIRPEPGYQVIESVPAPVAENDEVVAPEDRSDEAKLRREKMAAEYEKLEKARRNLELLLNRLRAIFWGKELPREDYEEISDTMQDGFALLKNKRLMGAYSGPDAIIDELSKVEFIYEELKQIEVQYRRKLTDSTNN